MDDLEKAPSHPETGGCLVVAVRLPVRVVTLLLVLPVRMAWDALVLAGRVVRDTVLRPVGRALAVLLRALWSLCVWPFAALWRYGALPLGRAIGWIWENLVVVTLVLVHRWVLTPLGHALLWLHARVLTPLGRAALWVLVPLARCLLTLCRWTGTALYWIARVLLVLPSVALWRWVLAPAGRVLLVVGREVADALGHAWRIAGRISLAAGRALAALLRLLLVDPARWVHRAVLTPVGHALRDTLLRPAGRAARAVGRAARETSAAARETARQVRADVRRALFGEPVPKIPVEHREPPAAGTRTLGSSTTALTKD